MKFGRNRVMTMLECLQKRTERQTTEWMDKPYTITRTTQSMMPSRKSPGFQLGTTPRQGPQGLG